MLYMIWGLSLGDRESVSSNNSKSGNAFLFVIIKRILYVLLPSAIALEFVALLLSRRRLLVKNASLQTTVNFRHQR